MARGGYRPGAGRKKGIASILAEKMRAELTERVKKEFGPLIDAQIDLAKGIVVEKEIILPDGTKEKRYYRREPDNAALKDLFDRAIGKPKETVEIEDKTLKIE